MNRLKRVFSAILAVSALSTALVGCAQIPRDGAIGIGPNIQGSVAGEYFYYSPSLPVDGMSAQDVVAGFLSAGTGPQNDYNIARQYLTDYLKSSWSPNNSVLIEHGSPQISISAEGKAEVTIQVEGEVTADGHYLSHPDLTERKLKYSLVKSQGEWRISGAPNLTVLLRPNFDVLFRGYSLYFFDQTYRHLVPDLRWFPARPSTATRLVNALLDGPSAWLTPGTVSAFPAGTKLSIDSVTITGGVATVDLSSQILQANADHRTYLQAQLWATIKQLPNVLSMQLLVDHVEQQITTYEASDPSRISSEPVELNANGLAHTSLAGAQPIAGATGLPGDATDFSLSRDETWLAILTPTGMQLGAVNPSGVKLQAADRRKTLLGPGFDANGYFWSVPKTAAGEIRAYDSNYKAHSVSAQSLAGYKRLAFSISPEGSRLAIVLSRGQHKVIALASIYRDKSGNPKYLGEPEFVATELKPSGTIAWLDANSIAFLTIGADGKKAPTVLTIGGTHRTLAPVDSAQSLAAGNEAGDVYVRLASGYLEVFQGTGWAAISSSSKALHFPGS